MRSRLAATRATAAQRPERTNMAFDFVAWKGGVACSEAVQTMGARLARCGRVPVQRVARSHGPCHGDRRSVCVYVSPITALERNSAGRCHCCAPGCRRHRLSRGMCMGMW